MALLVVNVASLLRLKVINLDLVCYKSYYAAASLETLRSNSKMKKIEGS